MKRSFPKHRPWLIAIVGHSGAGKTWLAQQLQARLGKETSLLRLDDFYQDRSHLPPGLRKRVNFDHPRSIDWPLLEQVLTGTRQGLPFQMPRYDFAQHARSGFEWWRPHPVVLVEGLWLLRRPSIRRLFDFSIFIRCGQKLCLSRRLKRDVAERGRSERSIRAQFREHVAPMGERYVEPQARWAGLVVTSPLSGEALDALEVRVLESLGEVQRKSKEA